MRHHLFPHLVIFPQSNTNTFWPAVRLSSRHQYGQLNTVFYLYSSADVPEHFNFLGVLHRVHRTFEYYYNGQKKYFLCTLLWKNSWEPGILKSDCLSCSHMSHFTCRMFQVKFLYWSWGQLLLFCLLMKMAMVFWDIIFCLSTHVCDIWVHWAGSQLKT